jgi:hypothetical protein
MVSHGTYVNLANLTGCGPTSMVASLILVTMFMIYSGTREAKYLLIAILLF